MCEDVSREWLARRQQQLPNVAVHSTFPAKHTQSMDTHTHEIHKAEANTGGMHAVQLLYKSQSINRSARFWLS